MWPACRVADHYSANERQELGWSVNSPPSIPSRSPLCEQWKHVVTGRQRGMMKTTPDHRWDNKNGGDNAWSVCACCLMFSSGVLRSSWVHLFLGNQEKFLSWTEFESVFPELHPNVLPDVSMDVNEQLHACIIMLRLLCFNIWNTVISLLNYMTFGACFRK